jgi:hypothetical protein
MCKRHLERLSHTVTYVDGILTDGGIYYDEQGKELKNSVLLTEPFFCRAACGHTNCRAHRVGIDFRQPAYGRLSGGGTVKSMMFNNPDSHGLYAKYEKFASLPARAT